MWSDEEWGGVRCFVASFSVFFIEGTVLLLSKWPSDWYIERIENWRVYKMLIRHRILGHRVRENKMNYEVKISMCRRFSSQKKGEHYVFQMKLCRRAQMQKRERRVEKDQSRVGKGENIYGVDLNHWNSLKAAEENYVNAVRWPKATNIQHTSYRWKKCYSFLCNGAKLVSIFHIRSSLSTHKAKEL